MNVGFFRHGIAAPRGTPGVAEGDRPLTSEGRRKTEMAAKGLRSLGLGFDAIYTNPLPRALQTAAILAKVLKLGKPQVLDALRPGVPARRVLDEVRGLPAPSPLLVGHEPQLSATVSLAVCGAPKGSFELKKAGLALVELEKTSATIRLLLTPGVLRKLGSA
jgi:phosphohistidine phosphatase